MRNLTFRFFVALITFATGILVASVWSFYPLHKSESPAAQRVQPQYPNRSEEILRVLMPNGWGDASQLNRFDRAEEIQILRAAQVEAKDERAIGIAFLLAALGDDYGDNRERLLEALKECGHKSYPQDAECTDFVAGYLMELCRRGDYSLFKPLFDVSEKADGAFSESLGGFYSDMLNEQPKQFLKALLLYPQKRQRELCWSAGIEDGGGMDEERFRNVSQKLIHISFLSDDSLSSVTRSCLSGVQRAHQEALAEMKSIAAK